MNDDAAARIAARLMELWRTSRPTINERVQLLHSSLDALTQNAADAEARTNGLEAAHKLSGVLGVFGLPQGSELASEIEFLLRQDQSLTSEDLSTLRAHLADLDAVIATRESA
ncbi:MAG TPA: Hpt domain-containing protein [Acidobacteriaceae bacterium]|jgi:HPt (histidine-containing phosphotransfer) domain-containing protein|nr:Hpt domain-containing protein [Acidobacteriaceae bacterium]